MKTRLSSILPYASFMFLIILLSITYGFAAFKFKTFPYSIFQQAYWILESLTQRPHHLYPIRHEHPGATTYKPQSVSKGQTLITSYWKENQWSAGAKLVDLNGNSLHHWSVDGSQLFPKSPHLDSLAGTKNHRSNYIHGSILLPSGDLVFNIEYLGLFKIDSCGKLIWSLPYRTHHSIHQNTDGNFWVSGMVWIDKGSKKAKEYPGLTPPFAEDTAILVSPEGKILKEVSLLKAIYESEYREIFWKLRRRTDDISHLNDVESLNKQMAPEFEGLDAGDLLVSFKELSVVAIIAQNGKIKFFDSSTFNNQHDPDFEPNGTISVFNNRADGTFYAKHLGGSNLISFYPSTTLISKSHKVKTPTFYTKTGGKHQLLKNGNRLITEANAGRIIEIDIYGSLVWDWIQQPYDNKYVPEVLEGTRYNYNQKTLKSWKCFNFKQPEITTNSKE